MACNTLDEFDFLIRGYECGFDGTITLASIMNYLQESASRQVSKYGFSKDDFIAAGSNLSWVLTRFHLKMSRYPKWQERVTIATWPCGGRKIVAERDFDIRCNGEIVGRAASEWMLLDLSTRKIAPVPQKVYDFTNDMRPRILGADHAFRRLHWNRCDISKDAMHARAKRSDIDHNGHVNNAHYIEWLLEALPANTGSIEEFEIAFKSETMVGDEVVSEALETGPGTYLARVCSTDGRDHAIAHIRTIDTAPQKEI